MLIHLNTAEQKPNFNVRKMWSLYSSIWHDSKMISDYNTTSDGWLEWKGNQYLIYYNSSMAMEDACHFCKQKHGDLVSIDSEAENVFLWIQVSSHMLATQHRSSKSNTN